MALQISAREYVEMEQIRVAAMQKTYQTIGWKPEVPLEEGLARTVDWYKMQLKNGAIKDPQ